MKIPDTDIEVRACRPPEKIEMSAHSGICKYCGGVVKMLRDIKTAKLMPKCCICLQCGQPYYVEINGTIEEWESKQWMQKEAILNKNVYHGKENPFDVRTTD